MGPKTSREYTESYSYEQQTYQNNTRNYAKWDHQPALASDDIRHTATKELQNLQKHHQLTTSLPHQTSIQPEKAITSSTMDLSGRKKLHSDSNIPRQPLGLRKSRSTEALSSLSNVVTAQQLIYDQSKRRRRNRSPGSQISLYSSQNETIDKPSSANGNKTSLLKTSRKKIPRDLQLVLIDQKELQNAREIGKGNFGTVYHAIYKGNRDVAIKRLKPQDGNSTQGTANDYDENMRELLHEAHIMTRLKHANLLCIIGVTFFGDKQQLSLVTDFMKNGSLLDYLRKHRETFLKSDSRNITMRLNSFGRQIFEAMLYLEERDIIHRDLAARNCLIGEGDTLKVGDFGLTTLTECGLYKATYSLTCAPRWTSPEALISAKYTSRSDVWSYGITLWEIYSLGDRPFGTMTNFAVTILLKNSSENLTRHLPKPRQFGSDETYTHIILPCLTYNVTMRPRFRDLRERLVTILY